METQYKVELDKRHYSALARGEEQVRAKQLREQGQRKRFPRGRASRGWPFSCGRWRERVLALLWDERRCGVLCWRLFGASVIPQQPERQAKDQGKECGSQHAPTERNRACGRNVQDARHKLRDRAAQQISQRANSQQQKAIQGKDTHALLLCGIRSQQWQVRDPVGRGDKALDE